MMGDGSGFIQELCKHECHEGESYSGENERHSGKK